MTNDFAQLLRSYPEHLRVIDIQTASMDYMKLRLALVIASGAPGPGPFPGFKWGRIVLCCTNAVWYTIREPNPARLEGGPGIEFYDAHELLNDPHLQLVPGGDGEVFNPAKKFSLMVLDQSQIIAEKFELEGGPEYFPSSGRVSTNTAT